MAQEQLPEHSAVTKAINAIISARTGEISFAYRTGYGTAYGRAVSEIAISLGLDRRPFEHHYQAQFGEDLSHLDVDLRTQVQERAAELLKLPGVRPELVSAFQEALRAEEAAITGRAQAHAGSAASVQEVAGGTNGPPEAGRHSPPPASAEGSGQGSVVRPPARER